MEAAVCLLAPNFSEVRFMSRKRYSRKFHTLQFV